MLRVNDVDLCLETFGDREDPAVLLIAGAASSMDWWEEEFCQSLADTGRFVIRYDLRDTGQSTSFPAGQPGYTGADLLQDAVGLLDALDLHTAHLVGISMGGGIAQRMALEYPERISSLTLIATSPIGPSSSELPPMAEHLSKMFSEPSPDPDWTDRAAVIAAFLDAERAFSGTIPLDEQRITAIAERAFDRTKDMAATQTNHWILEGGDPIRSNVGAIDVPTLVLHGTDDPLFPLGHGEALAREIPGAKLVPLEGLGHQMPPPVLWPTIIPAIAAHTAA